MPQIRGLLAETYRWPRRWRCSRNWVVSKHRQTVRRIAVERKRKGKQVRPLLFYSSMRARQEWPVASHSNYRLQPVWNESPARDLSFWHMIIGLLLLLSAQIKNSSRCCVLSLYLTTRIEYALSSPGVQQQELTFSLLLGVFPILSRRREWFLYFYPPFLPGPPPVVVPLDGCLNTIFFSGCCQRDNSTCCVCMLLYHFGV